MDRTVYGCSATELSAGDEVARSKLCRSGLVNLSVRANLAPLAPRIASIGGILCLRYTCRSRLTARSLLYRLS